VVATSFIGVFVGSGVGTAVGSAGVVTASPAFGGVTSREFVLAGLASFPQAASKTTSRGNSTISTFLMAHFCTTWNSCIKLSELIAKIHPLPAWEKVTATASC
ncbi:MAG: hypothetical protein QF357_12010, partial [Dehalococcoidia bacterium]|nr:hypothetical protein [Dehalococcoidia bacterium]